MAGRVLAKRLKKSVTWLGIFAIALHTMLWAFALPLAANAGPVDPFSVICHSGAGATAPADESPGGPKTTRSSACDHCNLCSATNAPPTPDVIIAGRLLPERVLAALNPASVERREGVTSDPKLARGPPQQA